MSQSGDYESLVNSRQPKRVAEEPSVFSAKEFERESDKADAVDPVATVSVAQAIAAVDRWKTVRGHGITFIALFLFSIVLYFRPYELVPALSPYTSMAFFIGVITLAIFFPTQLLIEGNLTARPREVNLILLLTLAAFLSMPLATNPGEAYDEFTSVLLKAIVIFIVIVNVVRTEFRFKMLIWLAFAVTIYLSYYAVHDYTNGIFREGSAFYGDQRIGGAIRGLFGNSNDLALHIVTMIPLAIGFAFAGKSPIRKLLYFGMAGLFCAGVIVTFSRGGFLGLVAVIFVLVRKFGRRNKTLSYVLMVAVIMGILALAPGAYSSRLSSIFNAAADTTGSRSQRNEILKRSIWVTLRYPLFGVGLGNFHYKSVQELVTHNAFTQVSSEMGIPALVIYIMFMVYPLRQLRKIEAETEGKPDKKKFHAWSIGIQTAIIGYMVASFFASVAYQWYIYYLVAYAVAARRLYVLQAASMLEPANEQIQTSDAVPSVSVPQHG